MEGFHHVLLNSSQLHFLAFSFGLQIWMRLIQQPSPMASTFKSGTSAGNSQGLVLESSNHNPTDKYPSQMASRMGNQGARRPENEGLAMGK